MKTRMKKTGISFLCAFLLFAAIPAIPEIKTFAAKERQSVMPEFFAMFNENGIAIRLYDVLDLETGDRTVFFRIRNAGEQEAGITMSGFRIGENIFLENTGYVKVAPGQEKEYQPLYLSYAFTEAGREELPFTSFSMDLKIIRTDTREVLYEGSCSAAIPEAFEPHMVCEAALSMRAQEQILREDGDVRITLLSLGKYAGSGDAHPVQGLLKVENLSGRRIPVYVHALRLNGITVNIEKAAGGDLPSGRTLFTQILVPKREIQRNSIKEINEAAVQIMTSETENTAAGNAHAGGAWYPVSLTESGSGEMNAEEGELLYEDEEVEVRFLGTDPVWYPLSGRTEFAWRFFFVNKGSRDLEIRFSDFVVDGEKAALGNEADKYSMSAVVGAGAKRNYRMMHFVDGEQPMPEISFRIRIQAPGSGELYRYPEDVQVLRADTNSGK